MTFSKEKNAYVSTLLGTEFFQIFNFLPLLKIGNILGMQP